MSVIRSRVSAGSVSEYLKCSTFLERRSEPHAKVRSPWVFAVIAGTYLASGTL